MTADGGGKDGILPLFCKKFGSDGAASGVDTYKGVCGLLYSFSGVSASVKRGVSGAITGRLRLTGEVIEIGPGMGGLRIEYCVSGDDDDEFHELFLRCC